jgi:hypothetical protein
VENFGDSGKVYLLELTSPTAYALQVYFDAFKIPRGSRMFIYDSEKTMFLGSFTHENNFVNNRLGTEFVKGNSLIIEYYEPNDVEFESQLHIERLVHIFNSNHKIIGQLYGGGSYCNTPNAPDYYGKFSKSYTNGNLSYWLDPYLSGATSIGTYNPSDINEHCYNGIKDSNETGVDCGGNCPPCNWTLPGGAGGWTFDSCNNGVKDNDETGIDCGGSCRPCGGVTQCTNCQKDGDEAGVDCGGSCPPCNNNCTKTDVVVYSDTYSDIPSYTAAGNSIETQGNVHIVNNQNVTFKAANKIILKLGFKVEKGSTFSAVIAPCECKQPCTILAPNVFTPNGDGSNDNLCYVVSGYNRYEAQIYNRQNQQIHQSSGDISGNIACIWNGNNSHSGQAYKVVSTFYSDCLNTSKTIEKIVNVFKSIDITENLEYFVEIPIVELNKKTDKVHVYPNPADELITIEYLCFSFHHKPFIYIVNKLGRVMYIKQNIDSKSFNINVSNFAKGLYIVKIVDDGEIFIKKFIKN